MNSSEKHRRNVSNCMNLKLKGWRLLVGKHNTSNPHRQKFYNSNSKKVKSPVLVLGGTTIPFFWRVCRIAQDKKTSGAWPCMSQISRCQANLQDMDESTAAARNAVLGAASNTQTQKNQLRWMKEIYHLKTMGLLRLLTQCHHQETGTSGIMGVWLISIVPGLGCGIEGLLKETPIYETLLILTWGFLWPGGFQGPSWPAAWGGDLRRPSKMGVTHSGNTPKTQGMEGLKIMGPWKRWRTY